MTLGWAVWPVIVFLLATMAVSGPWLANVDARRSPSRALVLATIVWAAYFAALVPWVWYVLARITPT